MRNAEALKKLHAEVLADPKADALLRVKCRWERMSHLAVLESWGDPRKWPDYAVLTRLETAEEALEWKYVRAESAPPETKQ